MTGLKLTAIAITVNLLIACGIITALFGFDALTGLFADFPVNLLIGISGLYCSGFLVGNKMERLITKWPNREMLIGVTGLLVILVIGTLSGSTVGFLDEGLRLNYPDYSIADAALDYYFKPFFWIMLFGCIPALVTGIPLGVAIRRQIVLNQ